MSYLDKIRTFYPKVPDKIKIGDKDVSFNYMTRLAITEARRNRLKKVLKNALKRIK